MNYNPYQFGAAQPTQPRFGAAPNNYPSQFASPQMIPQAALQQGMMMRPVTSLQEAAASQINFDGTAHWFYDTSADRLYSKTFDFQTGTAPIITYVREQPAPVVRYATVEVVESLVNEIQNLKNELDMLRKGVRNESDVPNE